MSIRSDGIPTLAKMRGNLRAHVTRPDDGGFANFKHNVDSELVCDRTLCCRPPLHNAGPAHRFTVHGCPTSYSAGHAPASNSRLTMQRSVWAEHTVPAHQLCRHQSRWQLAIANRNISVIHLSPHTRNKKVTPNASSSELAFPSTACGTVARRAANPLWCRQSSSGVEQRTHKPLVGGSNPSSGTIS